MHPRHRILSLAAALLAAAAHPALLLAQNTATAAKRTTAAAAAKPSAAPRTTVTTTTAATKPPTAPAAAKAADPDPALLLLSDIPESGTVAEIVAKSRAIAAAANALQNPLLRTRIRLALAQIESAPEDVRSIRRKHLAWLAVHSFAEAEKRIASDDAQGAANALHLVIRCDPTHTRARFFLAEILATKFGYHKESAFILRRGLPYLNLAASEANAYLHQYFNLLETLLLDREATNLAHGLLEKQTNLPPALRETVAMHAAKADFRIGNYATAAKTIRDHKLQGTQNRLLEAISLFNAGNTAAAIILLHRTIPETKGMERDAVLRQIANFHISLGQREQALRAAKQRVNEFPQNAQARIHCLYLFDPVKDRADYDRTLKYILENYSSNQAAMFALATFAARRGKVELANTCHHLSAKSQHGSFTKSDAPNSRHYVNRQNGFNHAAFTCSLIETLVRAKRPKDAVDACSKLRLYDKQFVRDTGGVINALLAAAYFSLGEKETAHLYVEEFLYEKNESTEAFFRLPEVLDQRDHAFSEPALLAAIDEIERIARRPREIPAHTCVAVASLLRSVKADAEALRILENAIRAHPTNAHVKAAFISARIANGAFSATAKNKDILTEIEELLLMRRPEPKIWNEIFRWLNSPNAPVSPRALSLRATLAKLARPDLTDNPDFS
ncbi:MAG: hypothetical protein LBS59_04895 [Puniceicoccales bacterium]|jgi:tetratricopeptide (TPR) repeat protein|nr:hypothetical protein [Puniceicoccales bacterium]